jgi:hypothetical protein
MSASNTTETKKMEMDEDVMGLDADLQERTITVVCGKEEKKSYSVSLKYLQISKLINTALEQDRDAAVFPLLDVTPAVFEQLLPYLVHHNGVNGTIIPYPAKSEKMVENCSDAWDAAYVDKLWVDDKGLFYKLMMAANYMDIRCLLHLCACKVGTLIKPNVIVSFVANNK